MEKREREEFLLQYCVFVVEFHLGVILSLKPDPCLLSEVYDVIWTRNMACRLNADLNYAIILATFIVGLWIVTGKGSRNAEML
jgi:hypothetical protein